MGIGTGIDKFEKELAGRSYDAGIGGFGSAVLEYLPDDGVSHVKQKCLSVADRFIEHGTQDELRKICGFDQAEIVQASLQLVNRDGNGVKLFGNGIAHGNKGNLVIAAGSIRFRINSR